MNQKRQLMNIGEAYSQVLNKVVVEKTASPKNLPADTFELNTAKNLKYKSKKKKIFVGKKSGPDGVDGVKPLPPQLKENEKFSVKSEKTQTPHINTFMNKKFDELFNDVVKGRVRLNEEDESLEADVEATAGLPEGEGDAILPGEDGGSPEGEEPQTPAEHLQAALDHIQLALDELASHEAAEGEDLPGLDDAEDTADAGEEVAGEATEMKEVKDSEGQKLQGKSNKVSGTATTLAKGKMVNGAISGGNDGELKPVKDSAHSALQGKNNKVNTTAKPGHQIGQ